MERSIMIQYTGTSSRSNYNDERTATIGCALPLVAAPSEARRRIEDPSSPLSAPFVFLFFLYLLSAHRSPPPSSTTLSSFAFSSSYRLPAASPLGAHRNKSKHLFGVVTGPRSHGGWIERGLRDPPELSPGPPWGFTRPEVRHQRDTCSTGNDPAGSRTILCSVYSARSSGGFNCRRDWCWGGAYTVSRFTDSVWNRLEPLLRRLDPSKIVRDSVVSLKVWEINQLVLELFFFEVIPFIYWVSRILLMRTNNIVPASNIRLLAQ